MTVCQVVYLVLVPGVVDVPTLGAEDFDCVLPRVVGQAHRQGRLTIAMNTRTAAKLAVLILLVHRAHASGGEYVSDVNQAIEHLCSILHQAVLLLCEDLVVG